MSSTSDECHFRLNKISNNTQAGLLVFNGGVPVVSACTFAANEVAGVVCQSEAAPRLSSCTVSDNAGCGMLFDANACGELRQCDVYGNTLAGVAAKNNASPTLLDCLIRDGKDAGLLVYGGGAPVLQGCEILRNALAGVAVSGAGAPALTRCVLRDNASGISVVDGGHGVYTDCTLAGNGVVQLEVVNCQGNDIPEVSLRCPFRACALVRCHACALTGGCTGANLRDFGRRGVRGGDPRRWLMLAARMRNQGP